MVWTVYDNPDRPRQAAHEHLDHGTGSGWSWRWYHIVCNAPSAWLICTMVAQTPYNKPKKNSTAHRQPGATSASIFELCGYFHGRLVRACNHLPRTSMRAGHTDSRLARWPSSQPSVACMGLVWMDMRHTKMLTCVKASIAIPSVKSVRDACGIFDHPTI